MIKDEFYNFPPTSKSDWIDQIKKDLKGKDFEKLLISDLWDELKIQPFYTAEDRPTSTVQNVLNSNCTLPGMPPRIWSNIVSVYVENEKLTNLEILKLLQNGADGLILFLKGTEDLNEILRDVLPQYIQLYFVPVGENSLVFQSIYNWVQTQQLQDNQLNGGILWSPFSALLSGETEAELQFILAAELVQNWKQFPSFFPMTLDFGIYSESGGTGIQELTYGLGELIEIADQLTQRGFTAETIFQNLAFQNAVGDLHFPEIAKMIALRSLIADLAANYDVSLAQESIHVIAKTSTWTYSLLDKNTNLIRQTYQAMAGILGGCNSLWVPPFGGMFATELEKRIARNVSSILRDEAYLDKVINPSAGSFYLDCLQQELTQKVKEKVSKLESEGGWLNHFSEGKLQNEIRANRLKNQEAVLENLVPKVGVNKYTLNEGFKNGSLFEEIEEKELELKPTRASYLVELQTLKSR